MLHLSVLTCELALGDQEIISSRFTWLPAVMMARFFFGAPVSDTGARGAGTTWESYSGLSSTHCQSDRRL